MSRYHKRKIVKPNPTSNDCVCNIVKKIVREQNKVKDQDCDHCCTILNKQLPDKECCVKHAHTTVPFMLFCGGTCEPFIGCGLFQAPQNDDDENFFGFVESPVFRAIQFEKNSDCCVKLELLLPVSGDCEVTPISEKSVRKVARYFPDGVPITNFIATGVCLTINLKDFAGITCLNPITPIL